MGGNGRRQPWRSRRVAVARIAFLVLALMLPVRAIAEVPDWVVFPGDTWETAAPGDAGLDADAFERWAAAQDPAFGQGYKGQYADGGGAVITRGGRIIRTWGDPAFKHQSASLGKAFLRLALQLALDDGLIASGDSLIREYWTGAGLLSHPHKHLDRGHHRGLTFNHLRNMRGGFPVTNGEFWRKRQQVPFWADWTGDPDRDNYAHVRPGLHDQYSSGGYWRLAQVLTAVWKRDLKDLLDERIMSRIGIPAERWDWLTGAEVRNDVDFYPESRGYGDYLDPPFTIDGNPVRGGPGWVVMSAEDLARVGLLVATGGVWEGERLVTRLGGNSAVGGNAMYGWGRIGDRDGYFSVGYVGTTLPVPSQDDMAGWLK